MDRARKRCFSSALVGAVEMHHIFKIAACSILPRAPFTRSIPCSFLLYLDHGAILYCKQQYIQCYDFIPNAPIGPFAMTSEAN